MEDDRELLVERAGERLQIEAARREAAALVALPGGRAIFWNVRASSKASRTRRIAVAVARALAGGVAVEVDVERERGRGDGLVGGGAVEDHAHADWPEIKPPVGITPAEVRPSERATAMTTLAGL